MMIREIIEEVETSAHPVAGALHKGEHFKILVIAFKKGMKLKDHRAHLFQNLRFWRAVLLTYKTGTKPT
jgi:hypothetical protein